MMMSNDKDLQFQDFGHQVASDVKTSRASDGATLYMFEHEGEGTKDTSKLISGDASGPLPSFWSFEYYQQYFNVDTDQVVNRLINSAVPRRGGNFITQHIRPMPDLYGPFWISVTLIFTTGIFGNLTSYFETAGGDQDYHWEYDFTIVTASATIIFSYVVMLPFGLYALFWYRKCDTDYTYLELLCMYGYSLTIFVPVSMLWLVHVDVFRWILIILAVLMSGTVLVITLWAAVKNDTKLVSYGVIIGILCLHALLAVGFKEYFFEAASVRKTASIPVENVIGHKFINDTNINPQLVVTGKPSKVEIERPALTGMAPDRPDVKREEIGGKSLEANMKKLEDLGKSLEENRKTKNVTDGKSVGNKVDTQNMLK